MEQLSPHHVPVYETRSEQRALWRECARRDQPVVAVRDARRGYIVRYDLQHLDAALAPDALAGLRRSTRRWRSYPTAGDGTGLDPVSGDLHAASEREARELASRLSAVVFDRSGWQ